MVQQTRATQGRPEPTCPSHTTADVKVAMLAAGLAALAWTGARAAGLVLEVRSGSATREIDLVSVVVTSLVVAIAGAGLLGVLERRTKQGLRIWTVVASAVWVASLVGPLSASRPSAALVLAGLHLLVGIVVIVGLRRTHVPSRDATSTRRVA